MNCLCSRQAIQKYIKANNSLGDVSDAMFKSHVNRAIVSGEKAGDFTRPKGMFRPVPDQVILVYIMVYMSCQSRVAPS